MGIFTSDKDAARAALHDGDPEPALEYNRRVQTEAADDDTCGGCIGAGTGACCCMCGKPRS